MVIRAVYHARGVALACNPASYMIKGSAHPKSMVMVGHALADPQLVPVGLGGCRAVAKLTQ